RRAPPLTFSARPASPPPPPAKSCCCLAAAAMVGPWPEKGNRSAAHLRSERVISGTRAAKLRVPTSDPPGGRHAAHARPDPDLRRAGLPVFPELLWRGGGRGPARRGGTHSPQRSARGLAREDRCAAHRLRRPHLQRGVPADGASSAPG